MDDASEELYLQKIEEFVQDEDLIISTEVLCRKLNLPITEAKHLIQKYLTDHRNTKPEELGVTYAILGTLKVEDKFCVILIAENNLDDKLKLFKSGYSKEIYSIQKAKCFDINSLELLNPEPREKALLGCFVGKNCVVSKKLARRPITNDVPKRKAESCRPEQAIAPAVKKTKMDENIIEKKASPTKMKIAKRPAQNGNKGIADFFSNMTERPSKKTSAQAQSNTNKENTKGENASVKEDKEVSKKVNETEPVYKLIDTDDEVVECKEDKEDSVVIKQSMKVADSKNRTKTPPSSKKIIKKRSRKDNESPKRSQKRRKRVIELSDSDDDIFGKAEDDDDTDCLSSENEASPKPIVKPPNNDPFAPKNKQKKLIDKSYVDEEGYMVTKKEWIAVSGSEDEEPKKQQEIPDVPPPKILNKNVQDKIGKKQVHDKNEPPTAAKGKGKKSKKVANQPSILSYFNKK